MQTLATFGVAILLIGFFTYRQTRWQPVRLSKLLRTPLIFTVVGLGLATLSAQQLPVGWHLDARDAGLIGLELVVAIVVGWWMGRLTQLRTIDGTVSSRLGGAGVAVFIGFITLRIGVGIAATALSAPLAAMPATVLLVVAAIKFVQAVVIRERVARHRASELMPAEPMVGAHRR